MLQTDVLVIGTGIAGCASALSAADNGATVLAVAKAPPDESNTYSAQGGVAAFLARTDSADLHLADTVRVGSGLSDMDVARRIVERGPAAVRWLEQLGTRFDTAADGSLLLGREGGHSVCRVVHARGDSTGAEIQDRLAGALRSHERITCRFDAFVRDLLICDGRCVGAVILTSGMELAVHAGAVVMASGGAGQVFRETTNPSGACGDGIALCFRAGARLADLEFVQFHPTVLYIAGASRFLISEVVRGAGAVLRDADGVKFMADAHEAADLAPRDVVSRAILARMVQTGDTHVYLDLTDVDTDPHVAFPSISKICRAFDIDIAKDPIPVRPGAHYLIGGVCTDGLGRTSVPGLYAVGEVAATFFHGANRLASNSLLEGAVIGLEVGLDASREVHLHPLPRPYTHSESSPTDAPRLQLDDMLYSLKSLMWRQVGLVREQKPLAEAIQRIALWERYLARARRPNPRSFELTNMLTASALIATGAITRHESRGTHFRSDDPGRDDATWCRHVYLERDASGTIAVECGHLLTPTDRVVGVSS